MIQATTNKRNNGMKITLIQIALKMQSSTTTKSSNRMPPNGYGFLREIQLCELVLNIIAQLEKSITNFIVGYYTRRNYNHSICLT